MLSITNTWQDAWQILIEHFFKFIFVSAVPLIIVYFFSLSTVGTFLVSIKTLSDPRQIFSLSSGFIYFAIVAIVIIAIVQIWSSIAVIVTVVNHRNIKIGEIFLKSLGFFWPFILMSILIGLIVTLGMLASYLLVTLLSIIVGLFNLGILNRYYIISDYLPGILTAVLSVFLIFSPYFLVDAKINAWVAIRKSFRLVKGFFWPIAIRIIIAYAILSTITFILKFVPYIGYYLAILINIPILAIYTYVLYKDLITNSNALQYTK
jgi:hypothetical protein